MLKKLVWFGLPLVILLILVAAPVFAKDNQTNGTPFDELWTAIHNLEARVTGLQAEAVPKVAFSSYVPRNNAVFLPGDSGYLVVTFAGELFDDGDVYDAATGTFTAPEAGVYHFDFALLTGAEGLEILSVNGAEHAIDRYPVLNLGTPASATIPLEAGDTVQVRVTAGAEIYISTGYFSGFRVY